MKSNTGFTAPLGLHLITDPGNDFYGCDSM
jgi:hypothetical protein